MANSDDHSRRGEAIAPPWWPWARRICIALIVLPFAWLLVTSTQPIRLNWGDPWSDIDIMTAGRFMAEDGFVATRFTPIVDVKPLDELSFRYVHYPPLAEIINGAVQRVTGSDSLTMFRILFTAFSALSVLFFFRYVRRIWGERVAWVASALFTTNSLWLKYADCIHSHPLHLLTGFAALYWLTRWIDRRRARDAAIFMAWCAAAFMSSYDYYFFLPIMIVFTPFLVGLRLRDRATIYAVLLGAIGCFAGLALKCGLAIWALGWDGFLTDLRFQFLERATTELSHPVTRDFEVILFFRHYRFFSPTFFIVIGVGAASLAVPRLRRWLPGPGVWPLLLAGLAFIFAMKQLFCEQYHVSLSLLPYFCVGGARLIVRASDHRIGRALAAAAVALTVGWHVKEVATFRYAFLDPADLAPLRAELDRNDDNGYLYSTLSFTPSFRYSLNRHMISTFHANPDQLAGWFEWHTRELGGSRPYVVHYEPFSAASEDTKVVSYFAGHLNQLRWLRDPWLSRKSRRRMLRKRVDEQLWIIDKVADPVLRSGAFTMYRLNPTKLRDFLFPRPTTVPAVMPAESVELARAADETVSGPEKLGDRVVRYSLHHRPKRLLIIAGGGTSVPPKQPRLWFQLLLPQDVSKPQTVTMTVIPTRPNQTLRVTGGAAFPLGAVGAPQVVTFTLPARDLERRIEEIPVRFEVDQIDEKGRGVAIQSIKLESSP